MAKQKQTRYHSEEQIVTLIDGAMETYRACLNRIDKLRQEKKEMQQGTATLTEIREVQETIDRLFRKAERLEKRRLPKLKEALAAYRTATFSFVGEDRAVVLP